VPRTILILGGTAEANALAAALAENPGLRVIVSLAGRTAMPRRPAGEIRSGGFGGADGLAAYLTATAVDQVIDATHPFAARMGWNAAIACTQAAVPLLRLERPAWVGQAGDYWTEIDDWSEAAALLTAGSRRVLLALGRQELAPFAHLDALWFLIRSVDAPDPLPAFGRSQTLQTRGPFTLADECRLLAEYDIDTIVCKNSGGDAAVAKLTAARQMGLKVVMRKRPSRPPTPTATTLAEAIAWLDQPLSPTGLP
jgi:precorrin-6A/cobalt-precorrin-6A reductase